jgi:Sulfotransferase family
VIPAPVRQKLHHVKVSDAGVSLERFPDFLIVGPQRTGTTWLHANLRFHPQIMLAEPKEIFFFSRLKTPQDPKFQSDDLVWYLQFFREPLWRVAAKNAITLWRYRALYRPRVRGEATASYATLDADVIAEIAALNPEIKVILMIRDPIERAWSHAKKDLARNRGRKLEDVSDEELREFFRGDYQRRCARYVENAESWAAHLRPGHLLLPLFDDIERRPEDLLVEVMRFLGVDSDRRFLGKQARDSVNPTGPSRIPDQHRRFLEELLGDDVRRTKERFGVGGG